LDFHCKGWPWEQPLRIAGLLDPTLFTAVTKTLTYLPNTGNLQWYNPLGSIRLLKDGTLNAVGLTNPGIEWWRRKIGPKINSSKIPIVASVASDNIEEIEKMAKILNSFDLIGIELNDSCVNIQRCDISAARTMKKCEALYEKSDFPVILKLSVTHPVEEIIPRLEKTIQAISINSIPWSLVFPNRLSPFAHLGGGSVSGKIIQPYTWNLVKKLTGMTKIPIIGPSVWEFPDIGKLRKLGAKAISFGSIFLRYPWRPTMYVRRDMKQRSKYNNPLD